MPSLAAVPQQTEADLLRPPVLANDQPYAVAGVVPACASPTGGNVQRPSCAGPHQAGPPRLSR